jgi:hypothetical protein
MATPASNPRVQFEQVSRELRSIFDQQPDIGILGILSGWILDRPNIFDPSSRRRPKPELLLVLSYLLFLAAGFAFFNLR